MGVVGGAVQRVDHPAPAGVGGVGSASLFGEDCVPGPLRLDPFDDQSLAGPIDIRDEVDDGALGLDLELTLVIFTLDLAGLTREALGEFENRCGIGTHRLGVTEAKERSRVFAGRVRDLFGGHFVERREHLSDQG